MNRSRIRIRAAVEADLDRIADLEVAAGQLFREIGLDEVADDPPPGRSSLLRWLGRGELLVADLDEGPDPRFHPAGYVVMGTVDGTAHLHQISVHPVAGRRGVGTRLLAAAQDWARSRSLTALTLTTYAEVPWNGPWYAAQGFEVVDPSHHGPGTTAVVLAEQAHGLDRHGRRVVMRRVVDGASTTLLAMADSASLAHDLRLATTRLVRRLRQEQPVSELTLSQISALAVVTQEGPITAGELAAREQVRPPTITRVVDSLVAAGLVDRRENPDDGRKILIEATDQGRGRIDEFIRIREEWLTDRLQQLDDRDRALLQDAMRVLDSITER